MALIHNVIIRILNCIYLQAPNIPSSNPTLQADFATFCHAWIVLIHEHHGNEEKYFFPWLEKAIGKEGFMEKNVQQHHAFFAGLEKFEGYIDAVREKREGFDGMKIVGLIDGFGTTLTDHLVDEVKTFEDLAEFDDKIDWAAWQKYVGEIAVSKADKVSTETALSVVQLLTGFKYYEIPVIMTNFDVPFEAPYHQTVWPPLPWIAGTMMRLLYIPRHSGAWRFSSCDTHGRPKELEFV